MIRPIVRRGFTLVELMVALSAGLVVASAAYVLARNSLDVFQNESRSFAAQYSGMTGMTRLSADIRRAGFMTSANPGVDPFRCGDIVNSVVGDDRRLRAITIVQGFVADAAIPTPAYDAYTGIYANASNLRVPDRLRVVGNYSTSEIFDLAPSDASDGNKLYLDVDAAATARVWRDDSGGGGGGGSDICSFFLGPAGEPRYAAMATSAGQTVLVKTTACAFQQTNSTTDNYGEVELTVVYLHTAPRCKEGLKTIAPLTVVEYLVANVANAADAVALGLPAGITTMTDPVEPLVTGDNERMELIRREITAAGVVVPGSGEIVSEYVVDLKFAARIRPIGGPAAPVLTDFGVPALSCAVGFDCPTSAPQRFRSLLVRLGTRARAPDNVSGDPAAPTAAQPLKRFAVLAGPSPRTRFARVRNLTTEIALPNMAGYIW